jgi:CheY-like chemotaxis protein
MEAIGNLTGGLAHDSNNHLGIVMGNLELLRETGTLNADCLELIDDALDAAARGAELNRQLLGFARRQQLQPKLTEIGDLVSNQIKLLRRTLGEQIEVTMTATPDLWPVFIDTAQLASALTNLAINARDAMPDGGRLTIHAYNGHLDADYASTHPEVVPGDYVAIEVTDTGTGISPENLARVFEPFFTTKPVGKGTGLGLSMVFGFIKQSNGHVSISSQVGCGTTIRLYLPRTDNADLEEDSLADAAAWSPDASAPPATVLAVEDNPQLRKVLVGQLHNLGYLVLEAENGEGALELLRDHRQIDLLLTDIVMPGSVNGYALARQAIADRPNLRVVFMSGFPGAAFGEGRALPETGLLLPKPFRQSELAAKLRQALLAQEPV